MKSVVKKVITPGRSLVFLIKFTFFRFLDTNTEIMYSHKTKQVDRLTVSTKKYLTQWDHFSENTKLTLATNKLKTSMIESFHED